MRVNGPAELLATLVLTVVVAPFSAPLANAAPGTARRQRVAVAHVDFEGNVSEAARGLFESRVVEGLAAAQFEVFASSAVSQKLAADGRRLANCRDGSCYPALAQVLGENYLVAARVSESNKN